MTLISTLNIIFTLNELPLSWPSSVIIVNLSWLFLCNSKVWPVMYTHNSQIYVSSSEISWELQIHISNYLYDIYFIDFSNLVQSSFGTCRELAPGPPRYQNLGMLVSHYLGPPVCRCGFSQPWIVQYCANLFLGWKKNPCVSGPVQFKPVLFKGQQYLFFLLTF